MKIINTNCTGSYKCPVSCTEREKEKKTHVEFNNRRRSSSGDLDPAPSKQKSSGSRGVAQTADKRLIPIDSRSIFCAETESEKFSKINLRTKSKKGK